MFYGIVELMSVDFWIFVGFLCAVVLIMGVVSFGWIQYVRV